MSLTRKSVVAVGQDIKVAAQVDQRPKIALRSAKAVEVARLFGLGHAPRKQSRRRKRRMETCAALPPVDLAPGTITLITGPSGAGKSSLLRELRRNHARRRRWIDLDLLRVRNVPIVGCFDRQPLMETLKLLARVGLGEAWSYLRTPRELSEGQKFRLKLAMGIYRAGEAAASAKPQAAVVACDEFAAMLDRLTAMIVSRCLRRTIDAHGHLAAVVATSHDDLIEALAPDVIVRCDFGPVEVVHRR
jgi:ABC-type ATPase with predicted acetyltransferase domain